MPDPGLPAREPVLLLPSLFHDAEPPGDLAVVVLVRAVVAVVAVELGQGLLGVSVGPVGGPAARLDLLLVDAPEGQFFLEQRSAHVRRGVQFAWTKGRVGLVSKGGAGLISKGRVGLISKGGVGLVSKGRVGLISKGGVGLVSNCLLYTSDAADES